MRVADFGLIFELRPSKSYAVDSGLNGMVFPDECDPVGDLEVQHLGDWIGELGLPALVSQRAQVPCRERLRVREPS